jgi:hypothetical protein
MDYKILSSKRRQAGLSMVEVVIVLGITGFVLLALGSLYLYSNRSFVTLKNHLDLDSASTRAMDQLGLEIRQADQMTSYTSNRITFVRNGVPYGFIYLPDKRQLVRKDNQSVKVLLEDCDGLRFDMYQRTPLPGGEGFYPALRAGLCKVVQVTWQSSKLTGRASPNASAFRSAQIVIRNQKDL